MIDLVCLIALYLTLLFPVGATLSPAVILSKQCPNDSIGSPYLQSCPPTGQPDDAVDNTKQRPLFVDSKARPSYQRGHTVGATQTHVPICTDLLPGVDDVLCVYTYANFSNYRGISIFTTPAIHAQFADLLQAHVTDPAATTNVEPSTWQAKFVPGKGIGARATKHLKYGDYISSFTPVLLLYMDEVLTSLDRERYLRAAVDQLPPATRALYFGLTRIYDDDRVPVQDVVKANSFEMQVGGQMHLAVFPEDSRFNHDCAPNTMYYIDPLRLTHVLHATRDIRPGEELTITYIDPFGTAKDRHYHLKASFHFGCGCERCADPEGSDQEGSEINLIHKHLQDWSWREDGLPESFPTTCAPSRYYRHPITNAAERLIELHEKSGLQGYLDTPYGNAALAYNSLGQGEVATMYAEKALVGLRLRLGPDGGLNGPVWRDFLREGPEKHWSWNKRRQLDN